MSDSASGGGAVRDLSSAAEAEEPSLGPELPRAARGAIPGGWPTLAILAAAAAALTLGLLREGAHGRTSQADANHADAGAAARAESLLSEAARSRLVPFEAALLGAGFAALAAQLVPRVRRWSFPPPCLAPRTGWGAVVVVQCVALSLLMILLSAEAGARFFPDGPRGTFLAHASAQASLGVALLPAILGPGARGALAELAALGLRTAHALSSALRGALGYLAALPLSLAAAEYARLAAELAGREAPPHPVIREIASAGPAETALLVLATCVLAPVFEELFFRGFLYAAVRDRWGVPAGLAVSSLLFASVHPGLPNQAATAVLGVAFAATYERSGTLAAPVTAHALFNGVQLAFVLGARAA